MRVLARLAVVELNDSRSEPPNHEFDDSLGRGGEESECHPVGGALAGAEVAMVTAGDSHTAALTRDGKVYSWGTCAPRNSSARNSAARNSSARNSAAQFF